MNKMIRMKNQDIKDATAKYPSMLDEKYGNPNVNNAGPTMASIPSISGMSVRLEQGHPPVFYDNSMGRDIVADTDKEEPTDLFVPTEHEEPVVEPVDGNKSTEPEIPEPEPDESEVNEKVSIQAVGDTSVDEPEDERPIPYELYELRDLIQMMEDLHMSAYDTLFVKVIVSGIVNLLKESGVDLYHHTTTSNDIIRVLPKELVQKALRSLDEDSILKLVCGEDSEVADMAIRVMFGNEDIPDAEMRGIRLGIRLFSKFKGR